MGIFEYFGSKNRNPIMTIFKEMIVIDINNHRTASSHP